MVSIVTIHDRDFNIVSANEEAKRILKLPSLDSTGVKCYEFYHGKNSLPEFCPSIKCLLKGEPIVLEIYEPFLNMYVELRVIPLYDYKNMLIGLMHLVRNITMH